MNTAGQIASLLCPLLVAYSVEWFGSWNFPLYFMGGLFAVGAVCWLLIDPEQPVFSTITPEGAA
jgi:MFS-type transporter involved in bile tolerance (Atg22 family)